MRVHLHLALVLLAACGKSETAVDRAGRATFGLGKACCDRATYQPVVPAPNVKDPNAVAMIAAGVVMWKPKAPIEVDVCGVQQRTDQVSLFAFHDELAQAMVSGTDCDKLIAACLEKLGEPARHVRESDLEMLHYKTSATILRLVSHRPADCELVVQDARAVVAMEDAMTASTKK